MTRDEGTYAYMALGMSRGEFPYRDTVQGKPPLLFALMLPISLAADGDTVVFRLLGAAWQAAAVLFVWRLGLAIMAPGAALAAAMVFSLASSDPSISGYMVAAENLSAPLAAGAAFLLWLGAVKSRASQAAWAGALAAAAALTKQSALPLLGFAALPWLAGLPRRKRKSFAFAFLAAWSAVILLAVAGLFAASLLKPFHSALGQEITHTFSGIGPARAAARLGETFAHASLTQGALWVCALAGALFGRIPPAGRRLLLLWTILAFAGSLVGRRAYPHYLLPIVLPLSLLAGAGIFAVASAGRSAALRTFRALAAAAFLFAVIYTLPLAASPRARQAGHLFPGNPFLESESVAAWLEENSPAESPVFIAGSEPQIAVMAKRRLAGRYPCIYPISGRVPGIEKEHSRWIEEALAQRPAAVVFCGNLTSWIDVPSSQDLMEELRGRVMKILESPDWRKAASIPPFEIYLPAPPRAAPP